LNDADGGNRCVRKYRTALLMAVLMSTTPFAKREGQFE
jgi:hypothetical protein